MTMNQGITITKLDKPFTTESGHRFEKAEAAYKTWGKLNENADNAVVILSCTHGPRGSRRVVSRTDRSRMCGRSG